MAIHTAVKRLSAGLPLVTATFAPSLKQHFELSPVLIQNPSFLQTWKSQAFAPAFNASDILDRKSQVICTTFSLCLRCGKITVMPTKPLGVLGSVKIQWSSLQHGNCSHIHQRTSDFQTQQSNCLRDQRQGWHRETLAFRYSKEKKPLTLHLISESRTCTTRRDQYTASKHWIIFNALGINLCSQGGLAWGAQYHESPMWALWEDLSST